MTEPYDEALRASYDAVLDELLAKADPGRGLADLRIRPDEPPPGADASRRLTGPRDHHVTPLPDIRFLTVTEAALIMRVSKMTVYRLVHSGELEAIRVGRSFRIPEPALRDYVTGEPDPQRPYPE